LTVPEYYAAEAYRDTAPPQDDPNEWDDYYRRRDAEQAAQEYLERFNQEVSLQIRALRVRDAARDAYAAERRGAIRLPIVHTLGSFLDVEDEATQYRIDSLMPVGAHGIIAAQYKAGKSTLVGNLIRCLVDGDQFLGRFDVAPVDRVVLIDNELDERTLRRWLRAQGIRNTAAVSLVSLRGHVSTFNIIDADVRSAWASAVSGADVVILDCLRPVLDALGLDENHDAGRFLTAFDEMLGEASVPETMIVHHMGHSGERSRGDSRLQDWPEVTWKLVRESEDPSSQRFFSAYGRDVDIPEARLEYEAEGRRLTIADGSRRDARVHDALAAVLALLAEHDALSGRQVEDALAATEHTQKDIRAALRKAHQDGLTVTYTGPRRATMHSLNPGATAP
jgi:hypothetical protein